ncbi:MAG: Re/Si-specific NAD(P)(+) transhydrogenase subunit alpha [Gemmatimonadota bacterium]
MRIGIPKETRPGERRVAATPETVAKMAARGGEVVVESGAGSGASISDSAYHDAGARVASTDEAWNAEVLLKVQPPSPAEAASLIPGTVVISLLWPAANPESFDALRERRVTALGIEAVPRIARAQKMDALSSMANLAGYKAVIEAANAYGRYFPLLMTAAGTIAPAQVLVIGAGVAGLSAIVTARRLGAVVRAFDPRPAVREQVQSLGARFLDLELTAEETAGGYAAAQSEEFVRKERELLERHLKEVDIVIAAALVAGQKAPVLLTDAMVRAMRPGSIVVDLAVEQGGNCALTRRNEVVEATGVTIIGWSDYAARVPVHGSQLYARNVLHLLLHVWGDRGIALDMQDEIVDATTLIHEGRDRRARGEPLPPVAQTAAGT